MDATKPVVSSFSPTLHVHLISASNNMGSSNSKFVAALCLVGALAASSPTLPGVEARPAWGIPAFRRTTTTSRRLPWTVRGGDAATVDSPVTPATQGADEPSLDDKVYAAMKKLGMSPPEQDAADDDGCKDGVCAMPGQEASAESTEEPVVQQDANELAASIAKDMDVDFNLAIAAIGATSTFGDKNQRIYNEQAARDMIQHELDLIASIPADSPEVTQLVEEGFDSFLSRRALAFAEKNMDDARAILIADQMDEEEEQKEQQQKEDEDEEAAMRAQLRAEQAAKKPDLVEVKADFDPTALPTTPKATPTPASTQPQGMPKPAAKEAVVFEATTAQLQEIVLESPVPVLLDVYADWCGPCKALTPALEDMAIKAGGVFRLVKVNSDNERPVSGALEVTALPTVFGIRDGKIVNMFQGMPKSEEMMKNFMMGLFGAAPFDPPVTADQSSKFEELTSKLVKTAGAASFSFSARERLTERIVNKLDLLVQDETVPDVEGAAGLLRTFMNNIANHPYEQKYRKINLENKLIASKLGKNPNALAVLKSVGFAKSGTEMVIGKGKKVINVAPLVVARDCIDKWIQKNRNEMAAAARKRKDEADREKLLAEKAEVGDEEEVEEEMEEPQDPTACTLKLRLDGKKKVHEVVLNENDPLSSVLGPLKVNTEEDEVQITCVAKRMVVKSSDTEAMSKSLKEHGLMPAAAIVVKVGSGKTSAAPSLKERAAEKRKKKGSHTMQSVGIYSKDDNNKAELIDGGGGVWYEHDVSDDEEEVKSDETESTPGDGDMDSEETDGSTEEAQE